MALPTTTNFGEEVLDSFSDDEWRALATDALITREAR
jgi:hypothetical protein